MIPRFKPALGARDVLAAIQPRPAAVARFEQAFAAQFEAADAIAFPYGRSALWAFLRMLDLTGAEVVMPAYTCVVVAHAVVLSGNEPRFVDITLDDYNMDLDRLESAIGPRTRVVIPTHLFGYPADVRRVEQIVRAAESRFGHRIWIVQDCAHAFGARRDGQLVSKSGDVALFGLGISKLMTSVFGGMLTTDDQELGSRLRTWRDAHFTRPGALKGGLRRAYLAAATAAFSERLYGPVVWLAENTPLLDRLTKAYHLDDEVHFPPDASEQMLPIEAEVGLRQLDRYDRIVTERRALARFYDEALPRVPGWVLPPLVDGATYSHYVVRVPDRPGVIRRLAARGVEIGEIIQYSVPEMPAYRDAAGGETFPNAGVARRQTINLPTGNPLASGVPARTVDEIRRAWT